MNRQATKDEDRIRDLIAGWSRAVEAKDAEAAVSAYTPETVLYDVMPPYRTVGAEAIREVWERAFPYFPDSFRSEHRDLSISVDGDVAFAHALHRFVPDPPDHPCGATWMRVTACYRRTTDGWRVAHEHVSVPFDPETGQAAFITEP